MSLHITKAGPYGYYTCDFVGGKPEHRSTCREAITVPYAEGQLTPDGWVAKENGHLCPEHADLVPTKGHIASLAATTRGGDDQ